MHRDEFLVKLGNLLLSIPVEERRAALDFYRDYFDEARDSGKTDAEITASLEPPYLIARRIRAEFAFAEAKRQPTPRNTGRVIGAVFGILTLPVTLPVACVVLAVGIVLAAVLLAVVTAVLAAVAAVAWAVISLGIQAGALLMAGGATGAEIALLSGVSVTSLGAAILAGVLAFLILRGISRLISRTSGFIYRKLTHRDREEAL